MAQNGTSNVMEFILTSPAVFGLRSLFYAVLPSESSFEKIHEVPEYVNKAVPFFMLLITLEMIVLKLQDGNSLRPPDAMSSLSAGLVSLLPLVLFRNIEVAAYMWIHEHYSAFALPWDSSITWLISFLGVDMGYYWVHRFAHEVNFMWAGHQVHHSSEDYNLTTALRQSVFQRYSSWIFYLPMAFFIPTSVFMVHIQFNLIFQFWIHTEVVDTLGPLEWVLNTPSHHRVHHGRNRYCIDKNFAGVLIIWDRMFGTFVPEGEKVVYGLVHPHSSWDTLYTQYCHWKYILETAWNMEGLENKVSVFLKGPGWEPGKPRTGLLTDIPDIHAPQERYNKKLPAFLTIYSFAHLTIALAGHEFIGQYKAEISPLTCLLFVLFLLWTLTDLGYLYEHKWYAAHLELARCVVYLVIDAYLCGGLDSTCPGALYWPRAIFLFSVSIWLVAFLKSSEKSHFD